MSVALVFAPQSATTVPDVDPRRTCTPTAPARYQLALTSEELELMDSVAPSAAEGPDPLSSGTMSARETDVAAGVAVVIAGAPGAALSTNISK